MKSNKNIFFVMGVSGSGKSTVGKLLAKKLDIPFFDGDDYHPESNVKKMAQGHPLNDDDRKDWLQRLNQLAKNQKNEGAVIACSALKKKYRKTLQQDLGKVVEFIYLDGSFELISQRMASRQGHFMPPELLRSQFETLEIPEKALSVSIDATPEEIISNILYKFESHSDSMDG